MGTVSFKLPSDIEARLNASVARRRTTRSRYLRQIVESHLDRTSDLEGSSALARAGKLVGSIKGAPADLSTNSRHLKGYGT
jgi:predicted transcriptional regulator